MKIPDVLISHWDLKAALGGERSQRTETPKDLVSTQPGERLYFEELSSTLKVDSVLND